MNKSKLLCQKRIISDIKEIYDNPLEGIGITEYNNNFMQYIINIKLQTGIYSGYCIQLLLTFNENYPTKPPKILIFPNQELDGRFHHHIFDDSYETGFKKFCFDLLDNDFMNVNEEKTGWNPSYTISSLLLQVQNFLSDPDMDPSHLPDKKLVDFLLKSNENYQKIFTDSKGNKIVHTWKNPFPKMYFQKENQNNINKKNEKDEQQRLKKIKENLTCFTLKLNYIDCPEILLGYPIVRLTIARNKIELYPIPELLSYDAYINQFERDQKLERYFDVPFKSANNEFYNAWVPIYINDDHYEKNKTSILNSFSIMKFGPRGIKSYDFEPNQIFEILPIILNKMIIGMFNNKNSMSESFIICYFHYILLFKKLVSEFIKEFDSYVQNVLNEIKYNNNEIDKKIIPDIGNFMMLLFFSDLEIPQKLWNCLFEEIFVRQMFWMFHSSEYQATMKNIVFDAIECNSDVQNNKNNKNNKNDSNKNKITIENDSIENKIMNSNDNFEYCDNKGILDDIINDLSKDENIIKFYKENKIQENIKILIKNELEKNFKNFIDKSTENLNKKITDLIVSKRGLSFILGDSNRKKNIKTNKKVANEKPENYDPKDYDKFKVENLLKKIHSKYSKKLLKYAYSSQRGNHLLLITFIAKKKMEDKNFISDLKKNYGVYLNVKSFIEEMKTKLKEINTYSSLYKFIGCDLLDNCSEMEYLIQSYEKAKQKQYIKINQNNNFNYSNSQYLRSTNNLFSRRLRNLCPVCGVVHN